MCPEGGREGVMKLEEFPCTGKLPHRELFILGVPRGSCRISESWTKLGLKGQKTEKAALFSPLTAHSLCHYLDGGLRELRVGRHTNLSSTYNPSGTEVVLSVPWHTNP